VRARRLVKRPLIQDEGRLVQQRQARRHANELYEPYRVSGRKLPISEAVRDIEGGGEMLNGWFWPRPRPNRQDSSAVATTHRSDLARGVSLAGFRPPSALAGSAPVPAPATPARSRAGCSSSPHSPHTANSPAAPRPDTG